jgi:2-polyprenyl-3-methyl-5-hydroxy-6-metoxy-1,4-benzoquinol methylase
LTSRWRRLCYRSYWKLERAITPGLRSSYDVYAETVVRHLPTGGAWLDIGCGHDIFPEWLKPLEEKAASRARWVAGIDYEIDGLKEHSRIRDRVVGDMEKSPFRNGSFDIATANMVVEHVNEPAALLVQINRLLKPGGVFVIHTPNCRNYKVRLAALTPQGLKNRLITLFEGRHEKDVFATRYRLNTPGAMRAAAAQAGLEIAELNMVNSSAVTAVLGPLAAGELLITRVLNQPAFEDYRSNIVAVLRKPESS